MSGGAIDIDYQANCEVCDDELKASADFSVTRNGHALLKISVTPCANCIAKAEEDARDE